MAPLQEEAKKNIRTSSHRSDPPLDHRSHLSIVPIKAWTVASAAIGTTKSSNPGTLAVTRSFIDIAKIEIAAT
jgi:hypothetical protein